MGIIIGIMEKKMEITITGFRVQGLRFRVPCLFQR